MKVIISPAKNMVVDADTLPPAGMPAFLADAEYLAGVLREMPYEAFRRVMGCSDALAKRAFEQYARLQPARAATPALLAYDGTAGIRRHPVQIHGPAGVRNGIF